MKNPKAVLISDIHFNLNTYDLASKVVTQARKKAEELKVPLIISGDLHDTKANIRGECIRAIQNCLIGSNQRTYILVGNHDLWNEKSTDDSLEFLNGIPYVQVVRIAPDTVVNPFTVIDGLYLLPYYNDIDRLKKHLRTIPSGSTLIMHQGVMGSEAGHYMQDPTALPKETFKDFRVISGHYHRRQDIKCGRPRRGAVGLFSYIGNPYTLNFGEAEDHEKGFQILMDDGTLEFVPTKLRKHIVIKVRVDEKSEVVHFVRKDVSINDIIWVKLSGPSSVINKISKDFISREYLNGISNFKLDLIPLDKEDNTKLQSSSMTGEQILDHIIETENDTVEYKAHLKSLWREVLGDE